MLAVGYFRERLRRAEKTNSTQFLRAEGAPRRTAGAAEPGPLRHAKIGKNRDGQHPPTADVEPQTRAQHPRLKIQSVQTKPINSIFSEDTIC